MRLTFVETPLFTSHARGIVNDLELFAVQEELLRDPDAGDLVAGTGGVRKIRVAIGGKGKRGGARVLYHYSRPAATVFLLLAYAKNETGNLSPAGKKRLKKLIEILDRET
ncbi:MAG: type II toxin-antitoxin system RelE/ParE family toxin [Gemmatimonadaceae bacterium]|nr:type II toxin-antitoxin system RelE/ParE family toxin [Gemmatimonadaceae bacterium]